MITLALAPEVLPLISVPAPKKIDSVNVTNGGVASLSLSSTLLTLLTLSVVENHSADL